VSAAARLFYRQGIGSVSVDAVADAAGVTKRTLYNHFRSKDEVVQGVSLWIAETLCHRIAESYAHIREGAERMAIGNRRYIWLAMRSPAWALLTLDVGAAAPHLVRKISADALADLRLGVRQKAFRIASEAAAMDLITGTVSQAMRSVALRQAPPRHDSAVATTVLRGLGLPFELAQQVARRPLPDLPGAQ
jgi:AcrR family transcriptional regulator